MKKTAFNELLQGVREAGSYLRGNRKAAARIDRISPDSIAAVRGKLGFSQTQFAHAIGISLDTLQNWEQGRRQPTGPAKVLLKVAAKHPEAILESVS
jgi:putative transcriptional regulator